MTSLRANAFSASYRSSRWPSFHAGMVAIARALAGSHSQRQRTCCDVVRRSQPDRNHPDLRKTVVRAPYMAPAAAERRNCPHGRSLPSSRYVACRRAPPLTAKRIMRRLQGWCHYEPYIMNFYVGRRMLTSNVDRKQLHAASARTGTAIMRARSWPTMPPISCELVIPCTNG